MPYIKEPLPNPLKEVDGKWVEKSKIEFDREWKTYWEERDKELKETRIKARLVVFAFVLCAISLLLLLNI